MNIFLYARKSSESEERQVQSVDDQLKVMRKKAKEMGYKIVEEFTENMSAKKPGRYKFNEMIDRVEKGEAKGIIAWKLDRLSRNPIDSGMIQFMLQRGKLDAVITSDREYTPIDSGLLMSVESGMANQYIIDLRKNVERGVRCKIEKGWSPGSLPEGYKRDHEDKTVLLDKVNSKLIRGMFELFLSGNYTISEIRYIANKQWGYLTRKRGKTMGLKPLSYSSMYKIFGNIFYVGNFMWNGVEYPGKHTPLLTNAEYNRIQQLLGKKGRQRPRIREYSYTGIIRCGECGCMITAEDKFRHIKSTNKTHHYIYYHCTKKNPEHKCSQKVITKDNLEIQIVDLLKSIEILPQFKNWAVDIIKRDFHKELEEREMIYTNLQNNLKVQETKLNNLTDGLLEERIDKDDFDRRKMGIKRDIKDIEGQIANTSDRRDEKLNITTEFFQFANTAVDSFNKGNLKAKRIIFNSLGQNFILKDGVLAIELYPWIKPLKKHAMKLTREYQGFETIKKSTTVSDSNAFDVVFLKWQP